MYLQLLNDFRPSNSREARSRSPALSRESDQDEKWGCAARQKTPCLLGASIDRVLNQVFADSAIMQQRSAFPGAPDPQPSSLPCAESRSPVAQVSFLFTCWATLVAGMESSPDFFSIWISDSTLASRNESNPPPGKQITAASRREWEFPRHRKSSSMTSECCWLQREK